jgi:hypothetical protein
VPLARNLWNFLPALTNGFSVLPPPATTPMVARHLGFNRLISPEGNLTIAA